jgi:hypothetical protein
MSTKVAEKLDWLQQQVEPARQAIRQAEANFNAVLGGIQVCEMLLAEEGKQSDAQPEQKDE